MAETFHRSISSLMCTTKRNLKLSKTFLSSFLNPSSHQRFHPRDRYGYSIIFLLWGACKFSNLVATLFATTKGFNGNYYFYYSYSIITNRKAPNSIILHTTNGLLQLRLLIKRLFCTPALPPRTVVGTAS